MLLLSLFVLYFILRTIYYFFFFSSRRRHTICYRDWSSDVCSSDLDKPCAGFGQCADFDALDARREIAGLKRFEHARAHRGELRGGAAHDDGDDIAAVGRLRLDQPARAIDAEPDAIARHAELELAGNARPEVAADCRGREEQDMRPRLLDDGSKRATTDLRVVLAQLGVLDDHDSLRAVPCRLARRTLHVAAEEERDVLAAELAGELAPLAKQLERSARHAAVDVLHEGPAVVAFAGLLSEPFRFVPV